MLNNLHELLGKNTRFKADSDLVQIDAEKERKLSLGSSEMNFESLKARKVQL